MTQNAAPTLSLFYCYAHEDAPLRDELDKHLAMLRQLGWIQSWSDRDIRAGADWQQAMGHYLDTAHLLLLLVSVDFINSDYCYGVELKRALKRHQAGEAIVIPILLRPVEWEKTPLSMLQVLPRDGRPVVGWDHRDEAFKQIATEIRMAVEALRRPVVVIAPQQQQAVAACLTSFLEVHDIPIRHIEPTSEAMKLQEAIRTSSAVLRIASPETHTAHLFKEVQNLASMYQCPVFSAWVGDTDQEIMQVPAKEWSDSIFTSPEPELQQEAFQKLLHHLQQLRYHTLFPHTPSASGAFTSPGEPRNPYKGLHAFTSNDTSDFFGRVTLIDELTCSIETLLSLEKKARPPARLLAVVGPSGSGKSSVVMAGLLPCLHIGKIFGSETWVYLDHLVPGEHPLEALALTLFDHFPEKSLQMLRDDLRHDATRGLHLYVTALARRTTSPHVVLVVDQFEELFTLTTDEQERQQFINLLVTACIQRDGPLIVILTLRADFYDRPMHYPAFYTLIEKHQVAMLPMALDDLRAVITRPAALPDVQITFEENLVGDLLFDVQGQPGALPLLQFTLDLLFQQRDGRLLTLSAYHEIGGVKGALSRHAEHTYQDLPSADHRTSAHVLFLRLIDPGFQEQDTTRRRASLSEFTFADATQTQYMRETIETFVKARLLTTNRRVDKTTIEVSHEAVIREWNRLDDWLREARDDIHLQQTISKDTAEWEQHNKSTDHLYRGSQLKEARVWAKRTTPSGDEAAFLRAAVHADTTRHRRYVANVTMIVLLVLSTTGLLSWLLTRPDATQVSNLQDNNNPGSLRYAINQAPANSIIRFAPDLHGRILLLSNLNIAKKLTIRGPGKGIIWISGGKSDHVVNIIQDAVVTISGLAFKDTTSSFSLISNNGSLTFKDSSVTNNIAADSGGGIYNNGSLTLMNSSVSNNTVPGNSGGGGIYNSGHVTLMNSFVLYNTSTGGGGGISNSGDVTLTNGSSVSHNTSTGWGGGISNDGGSLILTNSSVANNTTIGNEGGGIYNSGNSSLSLIKSSVSNNTARSGGGGISNLGSLILTNSSVVNNSATEGGGGISNNGGSLILTNSSVANNSATDDGGGIFNTASTYSGAGSLTITDSSVTNNTTTNDGGGIYNEDNTFSGSSFFTSTNSTISANKAAKSGGGMFIQSSVNGSTASIVHVDITFNTIYGNTALDGGDIAIEDIAVPNNGIASNDKPIKQRSQVKIRNSIVAGSPDHPGPDVKGILTSGGYNLFQDNSGTTFDPAASTQHATDESLLENDLYRLFAPVKLQDNGAPTQILALAPDSPAVDQVPLAACHMAITALKNSFGTPTILSYTITTDQRGVKRPDDGEDLCDIGAYE